MGARPAANGRVFFLYMGSVNLLYIPITFMLYTIKIEN